MKGEREKISVVVATYNGERFLAKQLESIVRQSRLPNEIIICDDRSSDRTYDIACEFAGKYSERIDIQVYQNEENLKFARNFLTGVSKASGDIVFLCDQDDLWDRDKLRVMAEIFENDEAVLSLNCSYALVDGEDRPIHSRYSIKQKQNGRIERVSWKAFLKSTNYPGMCMAIRKSLHDGCMASNPKSIPAHDWLYNEAASKQNGMYTVNRVLCYYRQHGNNTIGTVSDDTLNKESLLKNRLHSIEFFTSTHLFVRDKYADDRAVSDEMDKTLRMDAKRKDNIEKRSLFACVVLYASNMGKMSFRTFVGDLLAVMKLKH